MSRKTYLVLLTIAAALRILFIGHAPLWYDENFTLILARLPFDRMIAATAGDVHPPLWYLIEWTLFHALPSLPVWAIRIPSLIFSLLSFKMFILLCGTLRIPQRVRVMAAVLMAVMPMQLWYAQEGRMYAMLEFLVLAALYAGLNKRWILFFVTSLAMMYTQNYGMFYLAVIGMVIVVMDYLESAVMVALSTVAVLLLYMPWAFVIAGQMAEINGRYWIMDISAGVVLGAVYKQFWANSMLDEGVIASYMITFSVLIIGVWSVMREKHRAWWVIITMAFAPIGIAWIASVLWQPLLLYRPLIGISPFLYLIVAWPFGTWWHGYELLGNYRDRRLLYSACLVLPTLMFGIGGYFSNIADMKGEGAVSPLLETLTYVRANWQEGDVIYVTDDGPYVNIKLYAQDLPIYKMPGCYNLLSVAGYVIAEKVGFSPVLGSLSESTRIAIGENIVDIADVPHKRYWLYAPRSPLHPECYFPQIEAIGAVGIPLITVDDNEYIQSGVWLVEK